MVKTDSPNVSVGVRLTLLITTAMTMMAFAPLSPALPHIAQAFSSTPNAEYITRIALTIPSLGIILVSPFVGMLVDRIGRKRILLFAITVYGLSGTLVFWVTSIEELLVSRLITGVALAGIMTSATALAGDYFSGVARQRFMSQRGAFVNYAAVILNLAGGLLVAINWRAVFVVFSVGLIMLPIAWRTLARDRTSRSLEAKAKNLEKASIPLLTISTGLLLNLLFNSAFFMVPVQIPFLFREMGEPSSALSGVATATSAAGVATASLFYARIRQNRNPASIFVIGLALVFFGFLLVSQVSQVNHIFPSVVISGCGFGLLQANMFTWMLDITPERVRGRVSGAVATTTFGGQFLSPIINQPIADIYGSQGAFLAFALMMGTISAAIYAKKHILTDRRSAR